MVLSPAHLKLFRKFGVQAIYLFGSRALAREHALSDYDYAVLTHTSHHKGDVLYMKLYDVFAKISPRGVENDVIDIIFLHDAGLELKFHIIRHGKVIYDADSEARLTFEERTMLLYCDYRPILDEFDAAILERL